jgi:hypothetical protein
MNTDLLGSKVVGTNSYYQDTYGKICVIRGVSFNSEGAVYLLVEIADEKKLGIIKFGDAKLL